MYKNHEGNGIKRQLYKRLFGHERVNRAHDKWDPITHNATRVDIGEANMRHRHGANR